MDFADFKKLERKARSLNLSSNLNVKKAAGETPAPRVTGASPAASNVKLF